MAQNPYVSRPWEMTTAATTYIPPPVTIGGNANGSYYIPVPQPIVHNTPGLTPRADTAIDWLRRRVDEVCALAIDRITV